MKWRRTIERVAAILTCLAITGIVAIMVVDRHAQDEVEAADRWRVVIVDGAREVHMTAKTVARTGSGPIQILDADRGGQHYDIIYVLTGRVYCTALPAKAP